MSRRRTLGERGASMRRNQQNLTEKPLKIISAVSGRNNDETEPLRFAAFSAEPPLGGFW